MTKTMTNLPRVGVGVLILNDANEILLGRRIDSHGHGSWGPAGGHLEFGESLEECAIREVFEETGLRITSPQFLALMNDVFEEDKKHYVSIFMRTVYPKDQPIQNKEPHKIGEWQWFSWEKLPDDLFLPLRQLKDGEFYGGLEDTKKLIMAW